MKHWSSRPARLRSLSPTGPGSPATGGAGPHLTRGEGLGVGHSPSFQDGGCHEPTVVIFSGGGTRGFLHAGFLRALMEVPIPVASLDGISIGSWAASFLSLGMGIDEMERAALDFEASAVLSLGSFLSNILRHGSGYRGLFDHGRIRAMVEKVIGQATFRDTVLPLKIQATDLGSGQPFLFSRETTPDTPLSLAITASCCLAGIFEPVPFEGRVLVDGTYAGYIVPEDLPTIISNVSPVRTSSNLQEKSILTLMMRSSSILPQAMIDEYKRRNPRVLEVVHDCRDIGMLSFGVSLEKKRDLMARSYALCRQALSDYLERGKLGAVVAA